MKRRWRDEVIERAMRSPNSMVFAGHRFERRALQRMTARGVYRLIIWDGSYGDNRYTLDEIGEHTVIEA